MEQTIDFRFGDKYFITEFVQNKSFEIQNIAKKINNIPNSTSDKKVELVSIFIRDNFIYPLDSSGNPATDGTIRRYRKSWFRYLSASSRYYVWAFPSEVLIFRYGYCAETANLMTSILRALELKAYTALGEVRKTIDGRLLGYHAWTVTQYLNQGYLDETTIHKEANPLIATSVAYNPNSHFAQAGGIYYVEHARYDEIEYKAITQLGKSGIIFSLMGKPQEFLNIYGLEKLQQMSPKKLYRAWRKEEAVKINMVGEAFNDK